MGGVLTPISPPLATPLLLTKLAHFHEKKLVCNIIIVVLITWTVKFDFVLMLEHYVRGIHT